MNEVVPNVADVQTFLKFGESPLGLEAYLIVAAILFCFGLAACAARRNAIGILIGIELILNAANLNFLAFWRFHGSVSEGINAYDGPMFTMFIIVLAACEAAVALAIVINLFYTHGTVETDTVSEMRN